MRKIVFLDKSEQFCIVEDEEVNFKLLEITLSIKGYRVHNFSSVQELLDFLGKQKSQCFKKYISNGYYLIHNNLPAVHKAFFEHFMLYAKWVIDILNEFNISFTIIHKERYLVVNKTFLDVTGLTVGDLEGFKVGSMLHIKYRETIQENLKQQSEKETMGFISHASFTSMNHTVSNFALCIQHQVIGNVPYKMAYGFSDAYHDISNKETLVYLKYLTKELNSIIANLIKESFLRQAPKLQADLFLHQRNGWSRIRAQYGLTPRESEVLFYISKGLTSEDISKKLYISKRTVETHRTKILEKTDTKNSIELVRLVYKYGLLS